MKGEKRRGVTIGLAGPIPELIGELETMPPGHATIQFNVNAVNAGGEIADGKLPQALSKLTATNGELLRFCPKRAGDCASRGAESGRWPGKVWPVLFLNLDHLRHKSKGAAESPGCTQNFDPFRGRHSF
jgi:hypothetical protein